MLNGNSLNNIVRTVLQDQVATEAPAASVRDSLLAEAAHVRSRSALGPSIPALAHGLHESQVSADQPSVNRLSVFLEQAGTEKWLMMILPVYAIR